MNILKLSIEFLISFMIIYLIYYFFTIRKCKSNRKYVPVEVSLIASIYKINIEKVNLYKMTKVVCFVTSIILSISVVLMIYLSKNNIISLIIGTILAVVLAIIIYGFIGRYYSKKKSK